MMLPLMSSVSFAQSGSSSNSGFDGFISGAVGYGSNSGNNGLLTYSDMKSGFAGELRGSFSYDHTSGFGVQLDNQYTLQRFSSLGVGTTDLVVHGYFRDANYLLGAFAQRRTFDISQAGYSIHVPLARNFYGVEGQVYRDKFTVYTQLGAQDGSEYYYNSSNKAGFIGSVEARYFPEDTMKISIGYQYGVQKNNYLFSEYGGDNKASVYSIGVEYQLKNTPVTVFATAQHSNAQSSYLGYDADIKNTRVLVGGKIHFGDGSLFKRDRSGATLNPIKLDNSMLAIPNAG